MKMVFRRLAFCAGKRGLARFRVKTYNESPHAAAFLDDVYFHAAPPPAPELCWMPHYEVVGHLASSCNSESHRRQLPDSVQRKADAREIRDRMYGLSPESATGAALVAGVATAEQVIIGTR